MLILNHDNSMIALVDNIESFFIFKNDIKKEINKNMLNFGWLKKGIGFALKKARVMPAFGVSLHNETQNALKKDMWLQINFNEEQEITDEETRRMNTLRYEELKHHNEDVSGNEYFKAKEFGYSIK